MKTNEELQAFAVEYDSLCKKHGMQIVGVPKLIPTNHGTFEFAIELHAVPVPEQQPVTEA